MNPFGRLKRTFDDDLVVGSSAPAPSSGSGLSPDDIDLSALLGILMRRWLVIALAVVIGTSAGLGYALLAPKTWRATARVLVDPRDKQIVGQGVTQPIQGTDPAWVATQASLVTSEATLSRVVDGLGLDKDPDFGGSKEEAIRHLVELIEVDRADETYVLDVNVTSRSPLKSATIAGALADAYVASLVDSKADSVRQATALLGRQIDDLRARARDAELALQDYKTRNNLVVASGRMVDEERLRQLNEAFVTASVRAQETKARADRLTAALKAGRGAVDSALETADSAVLNRLKIEYALAQRSAAELARDLGPSHPRMQAVEANIERTRGLILDELRSLASTATNDAAEATAAAREARRALDDAAGLVNRNGVAGVRLKELENEADVRREMYRSFVSRMEQTALQAGTQVSDARVIVPASVPLKPYSPKRTLAVLLGFVAGLGLGLTAALYRGRGDLVPSGAAATAPIAPPIPVPAAPPQPIRAAEPPAWRRRKPLAEIFDSLREEDAPDPDEARHDGRDVAMPDERAPRAAANDPHPPRMASADAPDRHTERRAERVPEPAWAPAPEPAYERASRRTPPIPSEPHPDLVVLAEVSVDVAPRMVGRSGRLLVRSAREIIASVVEDRAGRERSDGLTAMTILADQLAGFGERPTITAVYGAAVGAGASAVAYGIARGSIAADRTVLLVDATPDTAVAAALCGRSVAALIDLSDEAVALIDAPVASDEGFDLIAAGSPREDRFVSDCACIADRLERLARGYRHVVIALGSDPDFDVMSALAATAETTVVVVDAAAEDDPASAMLIDGLAEITPHLSGLVLVDLADDTSARAVA